MNTKQVTTIAVGVALGSLLGNWIATAFPMTAGKNGNGKNGNGTGNGA